MSEIRVDNITDEAGTGSPSLPNGLGVTGDIDVSGKLTNGGVAGIDIDQSGFVFTPNQPIAAVSCSSGGNTTGQPVPFNKVRVNQGNHFDPNTYKFTCPVDGIYEVTYFSMTDGISSKHNVELLLNGARQELLRPFQSDTGGAYNQITGIGRFFFSANDVIHFELQDGTIHENSGGRYNQATFSLVG